MHIRCAKCSEVFEIPEVPTSAPVKCPACRRIFAYHPVLRAAPRARRIPTRLPCSVDGRPGRMLEVSKSGIVVSVKDVDFKREQEVQISLELPGSFEPLKVDGQVVRRIAPEARRWAVRIERVSDRTRFGRFLKVRERAAEIARRIRSKAKPSAPGGAP